MSASWSAFAIAYNTIPGAAFTYAFGFPLRDMDNQVYTLKASARTNVNTIRTVGYIYNSVNSPRIKACW